MKTIAIILSLVLVIAGCYNPGLLFFAPIFAGIWYFCKKEDEKNNKDFELFI